MASATKWGILSAGQISHDFIAVIQNLSQEEHQVVAIGARKLEDARILAEKFKIPKAYGSYDELAKDTNVEIVYIGTIHPYHCETTKLMLTHGKHVLCEKPMAMNYSEVKGMIDLARKKDLFLMEGIWSRFFPAYDFIRESLESGIMKSATFMTANHGVNFFGGANTGAKLDRVLLNKNGGGALMNVGIYPIQLAMLIFKEEPQRIVASGILARPNDIDKFTSITLYFSGDRAAQINLHFGAELKCSAFVSCEDSSATRVIELPFYIAPTKVITPQKTHEFPLPKTDVKFNFDRSGGFTYQIKGIRKSLLKGEIESPYFTHSDSLAAIKIIDEIRKQIGLQYEADRIQQNL